MLVIVKFTLLGVTYVGILRNSEFWFFFLEYSEDAWNSSILAAEHCQAGAEQQAVSPASEVFHISGGKRDCLQSQGLTAAHPFLALGSLLT